MKKILVTGGSGFIGRHSIKALIEKGYEVHAFFTNAFPEEFSQIYWHKINLLNPIEIEVFFKKHHFETLLHLAWYAEHGKFWSSPWNLDWVAATLTLARNFAKNGGKRFVGAGTCAEYHWDDNFSDELNTPLIPLTIYGLAKKNCQELLEKFFLQENISFCWGRIFYPFGPYEKSGRLIPTLIANLIQGKPALCTHGEQFRDFLFVEEMASIFVKLCESSYQGAINIGSGEPIRIKDLCFKIASYLNATHLLKLGAIEAPRHDTSFLVAKVDQLKKVVSIDRQTIDEGLIKTINWWQKEH